MFRGRLRSEHYEATRATNILHAMWTFGAERQMFRGRLRVEHHDALRATPYHVKQKSRCQ
jgi:hypothetical protein